MKSVWDVGCANSLYHRALWSRRSVEQRETFQYMRRAIEEGRKAIPKCGDNPPVGCIIVRNGAIVAEGHTNAPGQPHAEAMALSQLRGVTEDDAVFVTLEPCAFDGRTPSCAKALIESGIRSIYVGILDPDPRNNGKGIEKLRSSGMSVEIGVLSDEISAELDCFLGKAP